MLPLAEVDAWLERVLGIPHDMTDHVLGTVGIFALYIVIQRVTRNIVVRTVDDASSRFSLIKALSYVYGAIAFLLIVRVWFQSITGLATYLGLLSAGLAIALQDMLANLAGWVFILVRSPFRIGDRIEIGPHMGDVVDIRPFRFVLLEIGKWVHAEQGTGRAIHVPNNWVFKHPVANYDEAFGFIWNEVEVVVTYESDWRAAKKALERILREHAPELTDDDMRHIAKKGEDFHIRVGKLTPVVWTSAVDFGIRLTLRYLCRTRDRRRSTSELWETILDEFATMQRVDLAYPTTRHFDHIREGKPAMRPPSEDAMPPRASSAALPPVRPNDAD